MKKDSTSQFEPQENPNIFKKFNSELGTNLVKKLPIAANKFCRRTSVNQHISQNVVNCLA